MSSSGIAKVSPPNQTRQANIEQGMPSASEKLTAHPTLVVYLVVLVCVIAFFAAVRFRLRNVPLERDEGDYAYVGQLMLHGVLPFKLAGNLKLPGPYPIYALFMAVFGQTAGAIHIGLLLMNGATSFLIFLLGKKLYGPSCGTVAGCAYALVSARLSVLGLSAHATHFVVFFAVAGVIVYLRAIESNRAAPLFLSGLLLGTAYLMKQPGLFFSMFVAIDLIRRDWKSWRECHLMTRLAAYACGVALPFAVMCVIFLADGTFHRFWFWTVTYASAHANLLNVRDGWHNFRQVFFPWVTRPRALWFVAACGLVTLFRERATHSRALFVGGFALFSFAAVCPGLYFRPHYFVLMLPAVSLLVGIAVSFAADFLRQRPFRFLPSWAPAAACLLFFAIYAVGQRKICWTMTPLEVLDDEYPGGLFRQAVVAADYIRSQVPEGGQIAVLGSEPEISFYAQRRSASSYIHIQGFAENQPYAERMQREMIGEIEAARPAALVDVDDQISWGWTSELRPPNLNPALMLTWKRQYISQNYELAQTYPFSGYTEHLDAPNPSILVYLRKQK